MKKHFSSPLPRGKGFFVSGRRLTATFVLAAGTLAAVPAHAANVTVTLRVSPLHSASPVPIEECAVTVPVGADGVAVLDAASCVSSFETKAYSFGTYVTCINGICQATNNANPNIDGLVTFWMMSVNKAPTSYGVDGYHAAQGQVLEFSYTPSVVCFVAC